MLAQKLGIAVTFSDAGLCRKEYAVDDDTLRYFVRMLGFNADTPEDITASLQKIDNLRWKFPLEKIYVVEQGDVQFDAVVPTGLSPQDFRVDLQNIRSGEKCEISFEISNLDKINFIDGKNLSRPYFKITTPLEIGYYDLSLLAGGKIMHSRLAVCPSACYEAPALREQKLWGFALQLYSVKSERNWGVGDFTDLAEMVRIAARAGASVIGLNPLNVLMHDFPENASPYQSISRLFLNPIYIDVEKVPEFEPTDKQLIEGTLADVRNSELIQYSKVYALKIRLLEKCFARFQKTGDKERRAAFKQFCKEQGKELDKLAAFQTLYEYQCHQVWGGWCAWPQELRHPSSAAVKQFVKEHAARVEFFKYLQFEGERQFAEASRLVEELGLGIGFYRDLAVGVGKDSAELWSNPEVFLAGAGAGAPPDAFFPAGQKWCLGAFNPAALKEQAYEPFINILRANMKNAGALRIDHVMSLMRLYIIPDDSEKGTYLYYNFNDMLGIVALESCLNCCTIVGESIGNVPEGFLDVLNRRNIHSLSVLWSERCDAGWGDFVSPCGYPPRAFASVGTHDMAPLRMWWFGFDIELSYSLGLIPDEEQRQGAYHKRELDRWKLLFALDSNGVWPEDNPRSGNYIYGEAYPEGIEEAVHRFMSRAASQVFLAMPEDILHVEKLQNLPGTDRDRHPNWRRKLPVPLERLESDIAYIRNIAAIKKER